VSGENVSILNLPPGLHHDGTQYATGNKWFDGNQVRWYRQLLAPVGGWVQTHVFSAATQPIRDMFSWRDHLKEAWGAAGSSDKLFSFKVVGPSQYTVRNITPAGLAWSLSGISGYGRSGYGQGAYGKDHTAGLDSTGLWSMDNFGSLLVAVHSQDGRLFSYNPATPAVVAAPVLNAPIDNTLVIATEEEFLLVLGGENNPRRVKWCSQRNITDWTPTQTNSAGGFDLQSDGMIVAAIRVPGGVLVLTDTDVHMIEYTGPPYFYGRRQITDRSGCLSKNSIAGFPRGAMWAGISNFWLYDGAVTPIDCTVHSKVFYDSNLSLSSRLHMVNNEFAQEIWFSYPSKSANEADRYALMSFSQVPYWSLGDIPRTAWLNPVWTDKPLACNGNIMYEHEEGWTANGVSRNGVVFAESGALELSEGDVVSRCDRIYPDFTDIEGVAIPPETPIASLLFKLRQAPNAPQRTYGPVSLTSPKGYSNIRFRARQIIMRVNQEVDSFWIVGKLRMRVKAGGRR